MGRLDGRVAVVTGAGNGIGRACCERFAEEGADVVVADLLEGPGAETVTAVENCGRKALFVRADATSPSDNEAVMQQAVEAWGGVDILVTAAGISYAGYKSGDAEAELQMLSERGAALLDPVQRFVGLTIDEWHQVLDVNLTGTLLAMQSAARHMVGAGRGGSIVTIASIAAKHPEAGTVPYGVSKAGVWMLTKLAARCLGSAGIRVNSIGPGFIETNMTSILRHIPEFTDQVIPSLPLGRMGTPREVANTALFLASDESSYFTGELLHPDGGFYTD